ncbi:MAG: hypothetical protein A2V60_01210 [Candidatus Portnoybacteria bacterium RIFCSPHIGHO2_01_FULL_39_19]|nr:MAG: hypothetical protein A2V60_01210 [Candidatus Portnoybacteria bacterium RIFCSPHIGHO2_01_FULL_39_19]
MQRIKLELKDKPLEPLIKERSLIITPKRIILVVFILFLIGVGWYFWHEVCFLIKPLDLEIIQPSTDITANQENFEIIGRTNPVAYLTVNGQEVYIDKEGNFRKEISLTNGLNIIKIEAKNRFGKTNTIIRRIIYNQ